MLLTYPLQYLMPMYFLLYSFWLLRENRAILFWLYLWQLKEYHVCRFIDHFSTSKGRKIFLNPLFLIKLLFLIFATAFYVYIVSISRGISFFSAAFSIFFASYFTLTAYLFALVVMLIFVAEALWNIVSFSRGRILYPVLTKKSVTLIAITHLLAFATVIDFYRRILGEMSIPDFALAAFLLLALDVLTPVWVGIVVLLFQPFAVWQRNKTIGRAVKKRDSLKSLTVIGIAGSYGKSSTKEFLAHILAQKFPVAKTPANQNSEIGVAQAILNDVSEKHRFFVCEIGAYNKGRIKYVADIAKPKIGVLTGINQQHMSTFGSQQKIIDGKFEIIEVLPEDGTAVINWDSELVRSSFDAHKARIRARKIIYSSSSEKKDIWAENIEVGKERLYFKMCAADGDCADINLRLSGRQFVEPLLLAAATARQLGMKMPEIAQALRSFKVSQCGAKIRFGINGATVIDSSYSSNPTGALSHLDHLKLWDGKKVVVMPCLIELGKASKEVHKTIGRTIGKTCDLAIVATKDRFKELKAGALESGMPKEKIIFLDKNKKIIDTLNNFLGNNDVLLLEGRLPAELVAALKDEKRG